MCLLFLLYTCLRKRHRFAKAVILHAARGVYSTGIAAEVIFPGVFVDYFFRRTAVYKLWEGVDIQNNTLYFKVTFCGRFKMNPKEKQPAAAGHFGRSDSVFVCHFNELNEILRFSANTGSPITVVEKIVSDLPASQKVVNTSD